MAQTGTSNTIVNIMLGWLKGLASWVLRLFNLSGGFSPLRFLANNWLQLLVILLIAGVAVDLLIWLIRWRPHWVWFRKKRVIINDRNFFEGENDVDLEDEVEDDWEFDSDADWERRRNWRDNNFVVASAARREREARARQAAMRRKERAASEQDAMTDSEEPTDVFRDGLFDVNAKQRHSDRYEDEVFSVSNLPTAEASGAEAQSGPRVVRSGAGASRSAKRGTPRATAARRPAARKRPHPSANKR